MRIVSKSYAVASVLVTLGVACAAGKSTDPAAGGPKTASKEAADGGAATGPAGAAPISRPFAGSAQEATALIGTAIEKHSSDIEKCVREYRVRKNSPRERVTIAMGIDQEGRLLGATLPKGQTDNQLSECILAALANAPFPRSHSGVISITKSYEEIVQ